nr:933_t:CDS:2 [Entrophospora candida]
MTVDSTENINNNGNNNNYSTSPPLSPASAVSFHCNSHSDSDNPPKSNIATKKRSVTPTILLNQLLGNGDKPFFKVDRGEEELITVKHRDLKFELKLNDYSSSEETNGKLKEKESTQNPQKKMDPEKSNDDAKINGTSVKFETTVKPTIASHKNNIDDTKENRKEFLYHTRRLSTGREVMTLPPELQNEINKFSIDGFARKYFVTHKKGIFRRRVPVEKMLLFQKDSIRQPLLPLNENIQKDAIKCFKVIRYIMGDRSRGRLNLNNNISTINNNINGDISSGPHSKQNQLLSIQWLLDRGIFLGELRDEIYVQIYKQLNNNPSSVSIKKGWELLCVITITFPPSKNLESHLMRFISDNINKKENQIDVYSKHVYNRLTRICKKGPRGKVLTLGEIERAMVAPFNPSVFGETLEFIMDLQSQTLPTLKIPRILPFLADSILDLRGQSIEGIFRVPGDADYVTELKLRIEKNKYDIAGITDPHVPASLLKFWLRELAEPLIPNDFYERCINNSEDAVQTIEIIKQLPEINRKIVIFIVNFLQLFAEPEVCKITKMHVSNLAMIFAPNFLRCPSDHLGIILKNTKYEQTFMRTLILNLKNDHIDHGTSNGVDNNNNSNVNGHTNNIDIDDSEGASGLDILKNYKNLIKNNKIQQQQQPSYLQEGTVSGGKHQLS